MRNAVQIGRPKKALGGLMPGRRTAVVHSGTLPGHFWRKPLIFLDGHKLQRGWERRGRRVSATISPRFRRGPASRRTRPASRRSTRLCELQRAFGIRAGAGVHPDLLRRPRGTTVLSFRLILRASRVPGYDPDPQAPHSGSASGSSRETPLGEPEYNNYAFLFWIVNNPDKKNIAALTVVRRAGLCSKRQADVILCQGGRGDARTEDVIE